MQMPSSVSTRLQYQHKSLIEIIDGLSDEHIRRVQSIPVNGPSLKILFTLQTYQHVFIKRVKQILENSYHLLNAIAPKPTHCLPKIAVNQPVKSCRTC